MSILLFFVAYGLFSGTYRENMKGSIDVRNSVYTTQLSDAILQAAKELGYPVNDINSGKKTGFMKPQVNLNEFGSRWTSDQFLKKSQKRQKNLKVMTNALVEEILMLNKFEAYAVKFQMHDKMHIVYANMEIIVCGGSVATPKLLMLSGIGPKNVLLEANVS